MLIHEQVSTLEQQTAELQRRVSELSQTVEAAVARIDAMEQTATVRSLDQEPTKPARKK